MNESQSTFDDSFRPELRPDDYGEPIPEPYVDVRIGYPVYYLSAEDVKKLWILEANDAENYLTIARSVQYTALRRVQSIRDWPGVILLTFADYSNREIGELEKAVNKELLTGHGKIAKMTGPELPDKIVDYIYEILINTLDLTSVDRSKIGWYCCVSEDWQR